jgi:rfaE bifunctional protein kinase chain/domain
MTTDDMKSMLRALRSVRVGVIGDFALDVYFDLYDETSEISIETGKPVHYGSNLVCNLGGASNVVNNLFALGLKNIHVFGATGNDILGHELLRRFKQMGVRTNHLYVADDLQSCAYVKPFVRDEEASRVDFGTSAGVTAALRERILTGLRATIDELDVVIINQQFIHPLIDDETTQVLNAIISGNPKCQFCADLRKFGDRLKGAVLKVNAHEVAELLQADPFDEKDSLACLENARRLSQKTASPVLMTCGENGLVYASAGTHVSVPGIYLTGELDSVGAGDSAISAFAACLGGGVAIEDALYTANAAAAVTVRKLRQTGTASPTEILTVLSDCSFNHNLNLAHDPREATYVNGADIEIVAQLPDRLPIHTVIVDHDGTISTLREGWEAVMHPVMLAAICGEQLQDLSTHAYDRLSQMCRRFIDQTTGIQTIVQMQGLRDMVMEAGIIPRSAVKSAADYKGIYLKELMVTVHDRLRRLARGERSVADFTVLGAPALLHALRQKGMTLFLASGTDEADVRSEAQALSYADKFNGGIRGSKGNEIGDAKRIVVTRIIEEGKCQGPELMVIGDGPVEMLEGRRVGALCIGVASDEVRRHGINHAKRRRLIRAGAHVIVPDYSQLNQLLDIILKRT